MYPPAKFSAPSFFRYRQLPALYFISVTTERSVSVSTERSVSVSTERSVSVTTERFLFRCRQLQRSSVMPLGPNLRMHTCRNSYFVSDIITSWKLSAWLDGEFASRRAALNVANARSNVMAHVRVGHADGEDRARTAAMVFRLWAHNGLLSQTRKRKLEKYLNGEIALPTTRSQ